MQTPHPNYELHTNFIYQEYGRYAVSFEQMCHAMQLGVIQILSLNGLTNQNLAGIVVADQTAAPIVRMLQAMLAQIGNYDDADRRIAKKIFSEIDKEITTRNAYIHAAIFVGWAEIGATEFKEAESLKFKKGKSGAEYATEKYTAETFADAAKRCHVIKEKINRLASVVMMGRKISKNFTNDGDMPPGTSSIEP